MTGLREMCDELGIRPLELLQWEEEGRRGPLGWTHAEWAILREAVFVSQEAAKRYGEATNRLLRAVKLPRATPSGGSNETGTFAELLFASITTGTQLNTFTTEDNLMKTIPAVILPAGFFRNLGAAGKSLRIKAIGRLGTTGAPTFTWSVRLRTNRTWAADGVVISSAALTAGTTQTLAPWFLDFEIICRAIVDGATGTTLAMMGEVRSPLGLASPFAGSLPANNTTFTVTLDNTVTQYLYLSAACGTSNAANLIQLELLKVAGEN